MSPLVPGSSTFGPTGNAVCHSEAPDEVTCKRGTAVGYRIGLDEAWECLIPEVGSNGYLILEQGAWLSSREAFGVA